MIELLGNSSPNILKIMIILNELDLKWEFRHVDVPGGEHFSHDFAKLNPNRKVPIIIDHDIEGEPLVVFESGAILIYLAEKTGRLLPLDNPQRSVVLQWLMLQMASIGPYFGQYFHFTHMGDPSQHEYAARRYTNEVLRLFDVLESRLSDAPWLGGDAYSIADIATFPWVRHLYDAIGASIENQPSVSRWMAEIASRPAVMRAIEWQKVLRPLDEASMANADPIIADRLLNRTR